MESMTEGMLVEVTSDVEGFTGVWFLAKILKAPSTSRTRRSRKMLYLVEYQTLIVNDGDNKLLREHVDFRFLRPVPPAQEVEEGFQVGDVVDAYYNDGWWIGVVCQVFDESDGQKTNYNVVFEKPHDLLNFPGSSLRFHFDWVHGNWVKPPKKVIICNSREEHSIRILEGEKLDKSNNVVETAVAEDDPTLSVLKNISVKTVEPTDSSSKIKRVKSPIKKPRQEKLVRRGGSKRMRENPILKDGKLAENEGVVRAALEENTPRGPALAVFMNPSVMCNAPLNRTSGDKGQHEIGVQCDAATFMVDDKSDMVDEERSWERQSFQVCEGNSPLLSTIQSTIQSMEVFQMIPQKPHFHPLDGCNKILREGLAIGHWITFSNVAEQITKLYMDDFNSITFNNILECLQELESSGFDVKAMQTRLLKLQSIKESQKEHQTECEKLKCEIHKLKQKINEIKTKLDETTQELGVYENQLQAPERKRRLLAIRMEEVNSKIIKSQSVKRSIEEQTLQVEQSFKTLATFPW